MADICYNCGRQLTPENYTVEHVPAKNLYEGFGEEFKKNRLTVPACFECNNMYSKIDQELRDALAVKNDDTDYKQGLTAKGVRSIMRRSNWKDRAHFNNQGQVIAVNFSYDDLKQLHIKNFKALFFFLYRIPVPDDFQIDIIADGDDDKISTAQMLYGYITIDKKFGYSGHPDIFKYILKDLTPDLENNIVYESNNFSKLVGVAGLLVYHEDMAAIVVAGKKDWIKKLQTSKK